MSSSVPNLPPFRDVVTSISGAISRRLISDRMFNEDSVTLSLVQALSALDTVHYLTTLGQTASVKFQAYKPKHAVDEPLLGDLAIIVDIVRGEKTVSGIATFEAKMRQRAGRYPMLGDNPRQIPTQVAHNPIAGLLLYDPDWISCNADFTLIDEPIQSLVGVLPLQLGLATDIEWLHGLAVPFDWYLPLHLMQGFGLIYDAERVSNLLAGRYAYVLRTSVREIDLEMNLAPRRLDGLLDPFALMKRERVMAEITPDMTLEQVKELGLQSPTIKPKGPRMGR